MLGEGEGMLGEAHTAVQPLSCCATRHAAVLCHKRELWCCFDKQEWKTSGYLESSALTPYLDLSLSISSCFFTLSIFACCCRHRKDQVEYKQRCEETQEKGEKNGNIPKQLIAKYCNKQIMVVRGCN